MKSKNQDNEESFWSVLAVIRFFLAFLVFASHLPRFSGQLPLTLSIFLPLGGKAAVLGFLLISGLSIGHSYRQNSDGFYARRFLRIYPLYFFAVLFTLLLIPQIGSPYFLSGKTVVATGLATGIANFFLLQGFLSITIPYNGSLWSLSVEVFFYLLAPFLFKLRSNLILALLAISLLSFNFPMNWHYGYLALHYAWAWLIGFLISVKDKTQLAWLLILLGSIVTYFNKIDTSEPLSYLNFAVTSSIVLLIYNKSFSVSSRIQAIFNFLGEISYPFYLFHIPIGLAVHYYLGLRNAWAYLAICLVITILLNYLLDHWLKRIFWKPLVSWVTNRLIFFDMKLSSKL